MDQNELNFSAPPKEVPPEVPEVVPHPQGGYCAAYKTTGTCREYRHQRHTKKAVLALLVQIFPHLQSQARPSPARGTTVPLPLPKTDEALMASPA